MAFKKHKWASYNYGRSGHKIKIEVFDETRRKIETLQSNNDFGHKRNSTTLKEKYGIDLTPEIPKENSINMVEEEKKFLDKEMEW